MGREMDGFSYSSGKLRSGGQEVAGSSDLLQKPRTEFEANAAQTDSCFGLVPKDSDELARNYREFYDSVCEWVHAYAGNVLNAGLKLEQTRINYDAVDRPGK
ncbi:hypothetical protein [Nonomuraea basaltis]|uniref:hypothetical protein n=1 Tax=Nonomuraea basaltis TaxID=2495887 RepID=UPI00148725DA|nr:hypothetical protein [Nonomuraea basaltis]